MSKRRETEILREIIELAQDATGRDDIGPNTRLMQDLGLIGDDIDEFLGTVVGRYGTDISESDWRRHYPDEYSAIYFQIGQLIRWLLRRSLAAYEPITIAQLAAAVARGRWLYDGPPQEQQGREISIRYHQVAYGLGPAPMLMLWAIGQLYGDQNLSGMPPDPLFYLLAAALCLTPALGLGLSLWLYINDRAHRAPTLFLIIVHGFFLALVLSVAGTAALGF